MSRSRAVERSIVLLVVAACGFLVGYMRPVPAAEPAATIPPHEHHVAKHGFGGSGAGAQALEAGWYYTWYIDPTAGVDAEFVPMVKRGKDANSWYFDRVTALKQRDRPVTCLLGFNEPERKDQGDTTVDAAIAAWPGLMKLGLRLGSPAVSSDAAGERWLAGFMREAEQRHYRVDFIACHWYKDASEANAAAHLMAYLRGVHERYKRPIWLTEFAGMNWTFCKHPVTQEVNQRFLAELRPLLEAAPFVERYAWFSGSKESALFRDGKTFELNALGEIYRGRAHEDEHR